jgi:nitroreductase
MSALTKWAGDPESIFDLLKSRRVCRTFTEQEVKDDDLRKIVEAARWATSAGNRHIHKFLITRDPQKIRRIRSVSPGMLGNPPALVLILTDIKEANRQSVQIEVDPANFMDVGTAAMNMMLMTHALGLGSCPITSFSRSGASEMLGLPDHLVPEWILMLGHPAPTKRTMRVGAPRPVTAAQLTIWEEVGERDR